MKLRPALLPLVLLVACGHPPSAPTTPPPPVPIPFAPADAEDGLSLEQRVVVTTAFGSSTFDVIVETHEAEIVLVGLTTYGLRAFSVVHDASGLHVDAAPLREVASIPFDRVVRDVYAAFLLPLDARLASADVRLDPTFVEGRLVRRTIVFDPGSERPDTLVVDYGSVGWPSGGPPPDEVSVVHDALALRIAVTTRAFARSP